MRILILGIGRTGTSTLKTALREILNLPTIGEPWSSYLRNGNILSKQDVISKYSIVKNLFYQLPYDDSNSLTYYNKQYWENRIEFYKKFIKEYDHVILLSRKNRKDIEISLAYQITYGNYESWHKKYTVINEQELDYSQSDYIQKACDSLEKFSKETNIPITWYEDLYSGERNNVKKVISNWGFDIELDQLMEFVHPRHRLRQSNKKTLI